MKMNMKKVIMMIVMTMIIGVSVFAKTEVKNYKCKEERPTKLYIVYITEYDTNLLEISTTTTSYYYSGEIEFIDYKTIYVDFSSKEDMDNNYEDWKNYSASEIVDAINELFNNNPEVFRYCSYDGVYTGKFNYNENK